MEAAPEPVIVPEPASASTPFAASMPFPVSLPAESPDRLFQRVALAWVIAPTFILLAACVLQVGERREVVLPWLNLALPETCGLYSRFGIDCPGCGLTRSFIHIAHADPLAAWRLHPLSWLLFAFVAAQIPLAIAHLRGSRSAWLKPLTRANEWALVALAITLMLFWLGKLSVGFFG